MAGEIELDMRELVGCLIWAEEGRRSGSTASRAAELRAMVAGWLWWKLGEEDGSVSCAGPR